MALREESRRFGESGVHRQTGTGRGVVADDFDEARWSGLTGAFCLGQQSERILEAVAILGTERSGPKRTLSFLLGRCG